MPTYTMTHNKTGEEKDLFCSYDECVKFLEENPDWSQSYECSSIDYPHG
jgi:hypothetical protein